MTGVPIAEAVLVVEGVSLDQLEVGLEDKHVHVLASQRCRPPLSPRMQY